MKKYYWIASSVAYFSLLSLSYHGEHGDFKGLGTTLVFYATFLLFAAISGYLAYKATERIFIPNLFNAIPLFLANVLPFLLKNKGIPVDVWEGLTWIFAIIYAVSVISSAITHFVIKKNKKEEQGDQNGQSEQAEKRKRTYITKADRYFFTLLAITVIYFVIVVLFRIFVDHGFDMDGLVTILLLIFTFPLFFVGSIVLAVMAIREKLKSQAKKNTSNNDLN